MTKDEHIAVLVDAVLSADKIVRTIRDGHGDTEEKILTIMMVSLFMANVAVNMRAAHSGIDKPTIDNLADLMRAELDLIEGLDMSALEPIIRR